MIGRWTNWKPFPSAQKDWRIETTIGPGIYEVRRSTNGELIVFGHATCIARSLARVAWRSRISGWLALRPVDPAVEFEYRVCTTGSIDEAKTRAEHLRGRRQAMLRRFAWVAGP